MTDKATKGAATKAHATAKTNEAQHGTTGNVGGNSGLDTQGEFRIGANMTLAVRGDGLVLRQANSGREITVSEATLEGLLKAEYFDEDAG